MAKWGVKNEISFRSRTTSGCPRVQSSKLPEGSISAMEFQEKLKAFHSAFQNSPKKFWFWEVVQSTQWFEQILPISHEIQLCCASIHSKQRSIASCSWVQVFHSVFGNGLKKFWCWKVVQSTQWFEKIVPRKPQNSTMLCFNMFQTKIHSALLKVLHSVYGNSPKKFWFQKVVDVQSTEWFEKILPHKPWNSSMCSLNMF